MYVIHHLEQVYTCLRSNDEQIYRRLGHKKHDRNKPSSQGATLFEELVPMYIIFLYEHGILAGMSVLQVAGCRVLDSWWVPLHTPPVGTSEQEPDSYPRKSKRCSMHPGTAHD